MPTISPREEFKSEKSTVRELHTWITTTVARDYISICCNPHESMAKWVKNLENPCGQESDEENMNARKGYQKALKPLRSLNQALEWVDRWERAYGQAQARKVVETQDTKSLFTDFLKAV